MNPNIDIDPALARGLRRDVVAEVVDKIAAGNRRQSRHGLVSPAPAGVRRRRVKWLKRIGDSAGVLAMLTAVNRRRSWRAETLSWGSSDARLWLGFAIEAWTREGPSVKKQDFPLLCVSGHALERVHERLQLWTPEQILNEIRPAGQVGLFAIGALLAASIPPAATFLLPTRSGALLGQTAPSPGGKYDFTATTFVHDNWLGPQQRALKAALSAANDAFMATAPQTIGVPHFGDAEAWDRQFDTVAEILKSHTAGFTCPPTARSNPCGRQ